MMVSRGAKRFLPALIGFAFVALVAGCGRIYADGPAGDLVDGSADPAMVQNEGASDAGSRAEIDGDAAVDGAAVTCSSAAPGCTGLVLATVTGNPTSMTLLGDVLYWSDHSTKTIQRIPTQNGPVGSTALTAAGGFPSRLASVGGELAWFSDTLAGTGMPPRKESGQGDTLKTCAPSAGCAASSRSVAGTSAPASDGDGGIIFGTVDGTTNHAIRIPYDLASTASQDLTGSEPALVDTTYALGPRLVWFTSQNVNSCSFADCVGTRAKIAPLAGRVSASAAGNGAVVWVSQSPSVTIEGVTVTAAGGVSSVVTLLEVTVPVTAVFVDDGHVIFASDGIHGPGLYRCPMAGCATTRPELVARGGSDSARFIAADAQAFYWFVLDKSGLAFTVYRAPR
jgi:hypothetical protein